jgi:hypothetical protein
VYEVAVHSAKKFAFLRDVFFGGFFLINEFSRIYLDEANWPSQPFLKCSGLYYRVEYI